MTLKHLEIREYIIFGLEQVFGAEIGSNFKEFLLDFVDEVHFCSQHQILEQLAIIRNMIILAHLNY